VRRPVSIRRLQSITDLPCAVRSSRATATGGAGRLPRAVAAPAGSHPHGALREAECLSREHRRLLPRQAQEGGTAAGRYATNRYENSKGTPLANFFMTLAAKEDIELEAFGDSTGTREV
jgi:hypothetical protein